MVDMIMLLRDENGMYIPYVNGHGIKLLPSETTEIIQDLMVYSAQHDDTIKLENKETEEQLFKRW